MNLVADGMAFSEEIKIEALRNPRHPFRRNLDSVHIAAGRNQAEPVARRALQNLLFLIRKRFSPMEPGCCRDHRVIPRGTARTCCAPLLDPCAADLPARRDHRGG